MADSQTQARRVITQVRKSPDYVTESLASSPTVVAGTGLGIAQDVDRRDEAARPADRQSDGDIHRRRADHRRIGRSEGGARGRTN